MSAIASNSTTLVVLATSDLHGALTPKDSAQGSLANQSSVIADEQGKAAVSGDQLLLLDNGDASQGSDVVDWCATPDGCVPPVQMWCYVLHILVSPQTTSPAFGPMAHK